MDSLENVFLFLDYLTDTQRKRHVVGGVLMSVSLFFGGLAFTLMTVGSVNRRKARQTIRSPEQLFHPRCHFARQSKQIAFRLKKMGEDKLARIFDDDAALLLIINMWNLEIEDDDFSFVTQDMISPVLEGKTND